MTASDLAAAQSELSSVKRALLEIRSLRRRVAELERASQEPIAITGMAIRTSGGVHDVAGFADLLWNARDSITPIPASRWPIEQWYDEAQDKPGKMLTRFGGFVDDVEQFDAEFFGIAPREAASMDPQQRMLLELAWHALEDAGCAPSALSGTKAGVYVGIANNDYGRALFGDPNRIDAYFGSGNAYSVAAGRLSYFLGLHGPSIAIDTACSSSLVALHLACQALRQGECDLALAGGINLILTPEYNVNFSKAGMMARDGRCKTFDAAADGYVRGEGAALVVLRRARDAQARGERVQACIRGSAVNQDGRSNGLTAPNGPAQEAVVRAALEAAGVQPASIGYVEAHGTGTSLGDPIEVNALAAVLSEGRNVAQPLAIGSVKTNIGHLEAAAGIAGVVKAVLALQRGEIPPHLHLERLNPYVDWQSIPIIVPTVVTPWLPTDGLRLAGVSSFGFSGTNAHLILEQAPPRVPAAGGTGRETHILTLSARDQRALAALTSSYAHRLSKSVALEESLGDLCFTANAGRAHFAFRASVIGNSAAEMSAALEAYQRGESHVAVVTGQSVAIPRVAFLFPGQGPQYAGMGRELYDTSPAFRSAFDRCTQLLDALLPHPIGPVIFGEQGSAGLLDETAYAQPAMFAIEYALASLWQSWGVKPVAVMGHSFGEYAAACVAGALSLADAARMVVTRGRLVQALPRDGSMTVIEASEDAVRSALQQQAGRVSVAAINGPTNTVISGDRAAVEALAAQFAARGARIRNLNVSHAFHSPLMEPVLESFERAISGVSFAEPRMALVSNLSGRLAELQLIGRARYWRDHIREPVRFGDSMQTLAAMGVTHYIEMSPHPVLLGMGSDCVADAAWLPSLRQGKGSWPLLLRSLQALYGAGADIDWRGLDEGVPRQGVALPTYPFQRKRHWIDAAARNDSAVGLSALQRWQHLTRVMDRQSNDGPLDLNVTSYTAKWECLARLTAAHAIAVLRAADLFAQAGERRSVDEVMAAAGIATTYSHLVRRWLERLVTDGALQKEPDGYIAVAPLPEPALPQLWQEIEQLLADNQPLLAYVRHCGQLLGAVLTGRESPLETLFPGGSFELAESLYERSSIMRYVNSLAGAGFRSLADSAPSGRKLRVIEIGAGTGGTSSALLPLLIPERARYRYTDISATFFERARKRFDEFSFVEYGLFDLEQDLPAQGYEPHSFDIVVSANAVHATRDLRAALKRLHSLLAPGGMLLLVESTSHLDWFDMTTGLIEGWQSFADDLRGDNPLLAPGDWLGALAQAGFESVGAWPPAGSAASVLGQHVILARVAGEPATAGSELRFSEAPQTTPLQSAAQAAMQVPDWQAMFQRSLPEEQLGLLHELVCQQVMHVLQLDAASRPSRTDRLMALGMDSLMAVQLRNGLAATLALHRPLPSTLMFDYPTIDAIAAFLLTQLQSAQESPAGATTGGTDAIRTTHSAEAIAAMSDDEIAKLLLEQETTS
jgi:acyl transferase domain-containing protein/SAM-dependent methyltransferase